MKGIIEFIRQKENRHKLIVFMGLAAMVLLMLSSCGEKRGAVKTEESKSLYSFDPEQYTSRLEERLEEIISGIEGAGKTKVMITLQSDPRLIYALEESSSVDSSESSSQTSGSEEKESSVILVDTGDGEQPLVVTSIAPQINGVLVVCEGGDNEFVAERIKEAVTTVLGINPKRVCITKSSKF